MARIRMLVLAGGRSDEHEVSIISTKSLLKALEGSNIDATPLVITRAGNWLPAAASQKALTDGSAKSGGELTLQKAQGNQEFDVIFPLLHGPYGEDGTMQGMLELADLPYIGSGVLSSALCMDKPMSKDVLATHGIPQVKWVVSTRHEYKKDADGVLARCQDLKAPWFVKPANLGSSVGISKVTQSDKLDEAIRAALKFDRRVIIEEGVEGGREVEVAILGNDAPKASTVGEITYASAFYDYETKYTAGRADLHIPADLPADVVGRIQTMGIQAFKILDCAGFARIDFFYKPKTGEVLLNEVNTIPGFTPFSMYTKLWEAAGISYAELVGSLIDLAKDRYAERKR